jgi:hypothetical protein
VLEPVAQSWRQFGEEAWVDEAIAPHQQEIVRDSQQRPQLGRQSFSVMRHHMQDDIVRQTSLLNSRWYGGHPTEVELANTVFIEFFECHCKDIPPTVDGLGRSEKE